ncbi:SanA/YdcF family protein [Nocardia stercoris]|uniref:DUF218 domain-containing protein n=1 Tax=Nocardia stercoris TaxID=2483361 RepID=A0A3M2KW44_9NOCA|nr:ElyC/SanA/YdcF family protein [Nocardia stercoris]RMI29431.1 hypothetical protein EBN03_25440 [Nocardia stercoris]
MGSDPVGDQETEVIGTRPRRAATLARIGRVLRSKRVRVSGGVLAAVVAAAVVGSIAFVRFQAAGREYTVDSAPATEVGIVMGAQVMPDGRPSGYLAGRLDLAARLLAAGKVKALILTGDYGTRAYDEPDNMRRYLVAHGVPAAKLVVDYAGFDTYQSCARAYHVFGVRSATVVTTDFSVPRSIALCRSVGIDTAAVADHGQPMSAVYVKCWLRDQLAATKAAFSILTTPAPTFGSDGTERPALQAAMSASA